ncbi:hypothetical protein V1503_24515 [Bacillus sp. SCS-151]|uniref:hypothetical protein n=1 Tax=Nanhaiella sioensis TaxID=3115293 RepID=UPI00397AECA1
MKSKLIKTILLFSFVTSLFLNLVLFETTNDNAAIINNSYTKYLSNQFDIAYEMEYLVEAIDEGNTEYYTSALRKIKSASDENYYLRLPVETEVRAFVKSSYMSIFGLYEKSLTDSLTKEDLAEIKKLNNQYAVFTEGLEEIKISNLRTKEIKHELSTRIQKLIDSGYFED